MKIEPEHLNTALSFSEPTVQQWADPVFDKAGIRVDVLRLDRLHPLIGGNKWMKLSGFLEQAIAGGKTGILTKGGPWSNHVHACARACFELGLAFEAWIKGHPQLQSAMLTDVAAWNGQIRLVNRAVFYDEAAALSHAMAHNLLYVPLGGADAAGLQGTTRFLESLPLPVYDYAACAVGTATTFGGLAMVRNNFRQVLGVDAGTGDQQLTTLVAAWQQQLPQKTLLWTGAYHFGGFARYTPELLAFANDLFSLYGIPTDIVYTGKLFYAVRHLAEQEYFKSGSSLLLLHSGGLQGNRSLPPGLLAF